MGDGYSVTGVTKVYGCLLRMMYSVKHKPARTNRRIAHERRDSTMFKISARNQLKGTVCAIREGAVNGVVTIDLGDTKVKADITMDAIRELGLREGMQAVAIVKASNVMFAPGDASFAISARNRFAGTVTSIQKGAVNGKVQLTCANGTVISGSITNEAIEDLGLEQGKPAVAIVKSTDVLVGVEE